MYRKNEAGRKLQERLAGQIVFNVDTGEFVYIPKEGESNPMVINAKTKFLAIKLAAADVTQQLINQVQKHFGN